MVSIGGWTLSSQFAILAKTEDGRKKFSASSVKFMRDNELDGLDIDWEFPGNVRAPDKIDNQNDEGTPFEVAESKENFTLLMKQLREDLDVAGADDSRYYQLTAAIGSSSKLINQTEPDKYAQYLDFINIMSYDMHGAWENRTNHQSPIFENPNLPKDGINVKNAADLLKQYGVPASKIVIGSPFYSRGWKNVDCSGIMTKNKDNTDLPGLYCKSSGGAKGRWDGGRAAGVNSWYDVVNKMLNKDGFVTYRDQYSKVPYIYSTSKKEFYTYEDEISAQARVKFVNDNNYGGIIIWELSADTRTELGDPDKSLLNVIFNGFYGDSATTSIVNTVASVTIDTSILAQPTQDEEKEKEVKDLKVGDTGAKSATHIDGVKTFDASYVNPNAPSWATAPFYTKGDKIFHNGNICVLPSTIGYGIKDPPPSDGSWTPWVCEETTQLGSTAKIDNTKQTGIVAEANDIAKKLKENKLNEIVTKKSSDVADEKTTQAQSADLNIDESIVNPRAPTPSELQAEQKEANKCHKGQIYQKDNLCQIGTVWYKFKWWTQYDGTPTSSMIALASNEVDVPEIVVVSAGGVKRWSSNTVYAKAGMKVTHQGGVFESKYWTKGNVPEKFKGGTPWKFLGVADVSSTGDAGVQAPSTTQVKNTQTTKENPIVVADDKKGTTATFNPETNTTVVTESINPIVINSNVPTTTTFFMPFIDAVSWPPYDPSDAMAAGIKNFALSFVNSAGGVCEPTWGNFSAYPIDNDTLKIPSKIKKITDNGGSVMISFGGATAHSNELAQSCKNKTELAKAYQTTIDLTSAKMIDFDIEGGNSYNKVFVARRMDALAIIQSNNPNIEISFTLAVMPYGLLEASGLMVLRTAINKGIKFKMVNLMLMDYGTAYPSNVKGGLKMAAYSIQALDSVNKQLKTLLDGKTAIYPKDSNGEYYNMLGAIPMIGRNDTLNEYFYKDDVDTLTKYCNLKGVRMTSMWSLNRDKPISSGESATSMLYKSTKLNSTDYGSGKFEFSKILMKRN